MKNHIKNLFRLPSIWFAMIWTLTTVTWAQEEAGGPVRAATASPTLSITAPKAGAKWSNDVYTVTGTVKSTAVISNVLVSVNSGGWNPATLTGTTWSLEINLTPKTNVIAAYTQTDGGVHSKTNTVKLIYVIIAQPTVAIVGDGTVKTDLNGDNLVVGGKYTMKATAAKGWSFYYWSAGAFMTNNATLTFIMSPGLSITAYFKDITPPSVAITVPTSGELYNNATIAASGTATDNVAVASVWVQINGGGWGQATGTTSWTADGLAVITGTNTLQAYAVDEAGNFSKTNEVKFIGMPPAGPAPASLADTMAQVNINGGDGPFFVDFGASTFAQVGTNGEEGSYTGTYNYTLLSSNTALVNFSALLPPQSGGGDQLTVTFTDASDATFTDTNGNTGTITFSNAPDLTPSPSSSLTVQYVDTFGNSNSIVLGGGMFTNTDGLTYTNFGSYYFAPCSPLDMMLVENFTDAADAGDTGYVQLDFSSGTNGQFFLNEFDNNNDFLGSDSGAFTILSSASQPAGFAPDSAAGLIWNATPANGNPTFQICFGISTDSRSSSKDTNEDGVGEYFYAKTGPNTAQFTDFETEPLLGGPGGNGGYGSELADLTFTSATQATIARNGAELGTIKISTAKNLAPSSLSAKTITVKFSGFTATLTLQAGGTFTLTTSTGLTNDQGVYTYAQYSPIGAMLASGVTASTTGDVGKTTYVELTFTSSSGGNVFATTFDSLGNFDNSQNGTFTIP
jgi:hypothetical protein